MTTNKIKAIATRYAIDKLDHQPIPISDLINNTGEFGQHYHHKLTELIIGDAIDALIQDSPTQPQSHTHNLHS